MKNKANKKSGHITFILILRAQKLNDFFLSLSFNIRLLFTIMSSVSMGIN